MNNEYRVLTIKLETKTFANAYLLKKESLTACSRNIFYGNEAFWSDLNVFLTAISFAKILLLK